MTVIRIIIVFAIAYGSLYPFDFRFGELGEDAVDAFLWSWHARSGRGDLLGNVILFVPFGLIGTITTGNLGKAFRRMVLVLLAAAIFAAGLQFVQLYLPSRTAALNDVFWNLLGTAVGCLGGIVLSKYARRWLREGQGLQLVPLFLLGCWAALRLNPFVPSIDFQEIKNSLKPLLLHPEISVVGIAVNAASWLLAAFMLQRLGVQRLFGLKLALIIIATLSLEVLIVDNVVTVSNVIGAVIAWILALIILAPRRPAPVVLAMLVIAALVFQGLGPFALRPETATFGWVPFSGFLNGSMHHNTLVIVEKTFLYGGLIYLLRSAGLDWFRGMLITAVILASIEIAQLFFAHHTPEVTDPLLAVLLGAGMMALERTPKAPVQPAHRA